MRPSLLCLTLVLLVAACNKDSNPVQPTTGSGTAVEISGNTPYSGASNFTPTTLTTTVGSTVVWTNRHTEIHTTVSNASLWNSNNISPNGTFSHQFTTAGTYAYRCTLHPTMIGTIIVQ